MTIDTSALLAILLEEPERAAFLTAIATAERRLVSTVSILEAAMVLQSRHGDDAGYDLDRLLRAAEVERVAFDEAQLMLARDAFERFGKGRHPAGLNFGDCAAYALAQWSGEPLLFKGNDFGKTDVGRVMA